MYKFYYSNLKDWLILGLPTVASHLAAYVNLQGEVTHRWDWQSYMYDERL